MSELSRELARHRAILREQGNEVDVPFWSRRVKKGQGQDPSAIPLARECLEHPVSRGWLRRCDLRQAVLADLRHEAGRADLAALLAAATPAQWVQIDESMRINYVDPPVVLASPAAVIDVVIAGMSSDGHVREQAVRAAAALRDPLLGPLLALRAVDWVAPVAAEAATVLERRLPADPLLAAVTAPVIVALVGRQRPGPMPALLLRLAQTSPAHRVILLASPDRATRRFLLGSAGVLAAPSVDDLVALARSDPDPWCASRAGIAAVARLDPATDGDRLRSLLDGPALVVAAVVDALRTGEALLDIARPLLFTRSIRIRDAAQHALRRAGLDPAEPYRIAIASASLHTAIALEELGAIGGPEDRELVLAALASDDPRLRGAAVRATRFIANDAVAPLVAPLLADPSRAVSGAAARRLLVVASSLSGTLLRDLLAGPAHHRHSAAALLRRRSSGDRLEADLVLLRLGDERERALAIEDLRAWLRGRAARAPWEPMPARRRIADLLAVVESQLDDRLVAGLRFNAGLRPTDLAPPP